MRIPNEFNSDVVEVQLCYVLDRVSRGLVQIQFMGIKKWKPSLLVSIITGSEPQGTSR